MTLVGAVVGDRLGDPSRYGLDAMAAAAFLALLWPRLRSREPQAVAVLSGVVAVICIPAVPAGIPVLVAGAIALIVAAVNRHHPVSTDEQPGHGVREVGS
jgi:predicted branched-subunit amino acid permease